MCVGASMRRASPSRKAPHAHAIALIKTRHQNWPSETDAEIRAFVFGFAIRRQGRAPHMPRVRGYFALNHKNVQKQRLAGWGARIRTRAWRNQNLSGEHDVA